jgi:HAD superfamily hydrolase (TIGR01509 family)
MADNRAMHALQPRFDAVLFDLDGTLVDSETTAMDVLHEEGVALGLALSREEAHEAFRGQPMGRCVAFIAERLPPVMALREDFATDFTALIRRRQAERFRQSLSPMPGARELLQALQLPYCVATNGPREKAELTLGLTGLLPFFENRLFCAYEVGSFKPEPGLFLHAAQALGVRPAHCAVVEDSLPGVRAGVAAGMQVFSLTSVDATLMASGRVQRIAGLSELNRLLTG